MVNLVLYQRGMVRYRKVGTVPAGRSHQRGDEYNKKYNHNDLMNTE